MSSFPGAPRSAVEDSRNDWISAGPHVGCACFTSAAAPATCGEAADVPANPDSSQREYGPYVALETLSGAARSGLVRPSIVGPSELKSSIVFALQHIAPAARTAGDEAGSTMLPCCVWYSSCGISATKRSRRGSALPLRWTIET